MGNKKNRNKIIFPSARPISAPQQIPVGAYTLAAKQQIEVHTGPLPAPATLEQYDKIVPGAAQRILAMAEKQVNHRIALEAQILPSREKQSSRGQMFAFIACLAMLAIAALAIVYNHPVVASIIFSCTLASVIALFLKASKVPVQQNPQEKQAEKK